MVAKNNLDAFYKTIDGREIKTEGTYRGAENNVNLSSILTVLIQEAGRWCRSYASDLFIYWEALTERMKDGSLETGSMLFGFRELGVDNAKSIFHHYTQSPYVAAHEYRSIWRLDIVVSECEMGYKAHFTLYPVNR